MSDTSISVQAACRQLFRGRHEPGTLPAVAARLARALGQEALCQEMRTADPAEALRSLERGLSREPVQTLRGLQPRLERARPPGRKRGRPAASFIKWAGSKARLMDQLLARVPRRFGTYFEPMAGSGTVFFALAPARAVLGDLNAELINCYQVLRDDLPGLLRQLARHDNEARHYLEVRAQDPRALPATARAARTIFLNKTCYNGLYRVNGRGAFNVPYGRLYWANVVDEPTLRRTHAQLQGVQLVAFSNVL